MTMDSTRSVDIEESLRRAGDGVVILDRDWVCVFANPAAARLMGLPLDQLVGHHSWDDFPFLVGTDVYDAYLRAMTTQEVQQFDEYFPGLDVWCEVRAYPSTDGLTVIFRDITRDRRSRDERRRAESEAAANHADRALFEAVVEASPDFVAMAELDGPVLYVNPAGRAITAAGEAKDLSHLRVRDFQTEAGRTVFERDRFPALTGGQRIWTGPSELPRFDGGPPTPVRLSTFMIDEPATGRPAFLATIQRDARPELAVAEQLRAEAEGRRELLDRVVEVQESQRSRIADDIHDDSVQALAALDLRLGVVERLVRADAPDCAAQVAAVRQSVTEASDRLRHLLRELEAPPLNTTLHDGINAVVGRALYGTQIMSEVVGDVSLTLPDPERIQALRGVRGAVLACRRDGVRSVTVRVSELHDGVAIDVQDDRPMSGSGPEGEVDSDRLRQAAELVGGWCRTEDSPGGRLVRLWFPRL